MNEHVSILSPYMNFMLDSINVIYIINITYTIYILY